MGDKTQALLVRGQSVRICKHRRKVGGEYASVRDIFWREDEPWVVEALIKSGVEVNGLTRDRKPVLGMGMGIGQFVAVKTRPVVEAARYM